MLEYPFKWYLMNDSDSFVLEPKLPDYLYKDTNTLWGNVVDDFRVNMPEFGPKFHLPLPQIAIQPPYFFSRQVLEKIVSQCGNIKACPTTPFLDWYFVQCCDKAHLKHSRYATCASCETVTDNGIAVMSECVSLRGATFVHSIKKANVRQKLQDLYYARL